MGPHTAWVRRLFEKTVWSRFAVGPWEKVAFANCREECFDAVEYWIRDNPFEEREWVVIPGDKPPMGGPK